MGWWLSRRPVTLATLGRAGRLTGAPASLGRSLAGLALGLVVALLAGAYVVQQREAVLRDAESDLHNLGFALGAWIEAGLRGVDQLTAATVERIQSEGIDTPEKLSAFCASRESHEALRLRLEALPRVRSLTVTDASGQAIVTSHQWPSPAINLAQHDFFRGLRDSPERASFLSAPAPSQFDSRLSLHHAHRIVAPDGRFLGVVVAAIELAPFGELFAGLAHGTGSAIMLDRTDGMLLARYPRVDHLIGTVVPRSIPVGLVRTIGASRVVHGVSPVDNVERVTVVRPVEGYGLRLLTSRTRDDVLAAWRRDSARIGIVVLIIEVLILAGVLLANRLVQVREREQSAEARAYHTALDAIFGNGTAGLVEVDFATGIYLRVNRRYCELTGRSEAELLGTLRASDLVHPDDRGKTREAWRTSVADVGKWENELRYQRPDGSVVWGRISLAISARDSEGRPLRCIGMVQDITELKVTAERLRTSEALLRLGMMIGQIGTYTRDFVTGINQCGSETRVLHGLPAGEAPISDATWFQTLVPEDRPRIRDEIAANIARCQPEVTYHYRIHRRGEEAARHMEARTGYEYDADGRPLRSAGVVIDVTESRKAADMLRLCMKVGRIGTYTRNFVTGEIFAGAETLALHGLPRTATPISTAAWLATMLPADRDRVQAIIADAVAARRSEITLEYRVRHPADKRVRHIEIRTHFEFDEAGQPILDNGAVIDVTESREAEALHRMALATSKVGTFRHDFTTGLLHCGPETREICGFPAGDEPIREEDWFAGLLPEDIGRLRADMEEAARNQQAEGVGTYRVRGNSDGRPRFIEARVHRDFDGDGRLLSALGVVIDVTEQREAEELLRMSLAVGRIGSFCHDFTTDMVQCSPEARAMNGLPMGDAPLTVEQWWAPLLPEDREMLRKNIAKTAEGRVSETTLSYRIHHLGDGRLRHLEARTRWDYAPDGRPLSAFGVIIDVTARQAAEERIAHLARHDALTGLPNRTLFRERVDEASARERRGDGFALLLIDLDRFKDVNDTLGHPIGDALLRAATARLQRELRETDTLARLGGDEFAVILARVVEPGAAATLARRLVEMLAVPFDLDGHQVCIGASIGIAMAPADGVTADQLVRNADMALYRSKADGRGCWSFFEPSMDAAMQQRRALELDLRRALSGHEFELFFQPIIDLRSGCVSGLEALLRWRHPERGLMAPDAFIPLAEEIGLIVPIGEWVIAGACAEAATWPGEVRVAVNLSPAQLVHRGLVDAVAAALAASGLAAHRLELEITERVLLKETAATVSTLQRLQALGVRVALDDFGTGHSSLNHLRRMRFDTIKLDGVFTRELGVSRESQAIMHVVAGLCDSLAIMPTAEGVETEAQLDALLAEGYGEAQGYLFSPPRPAREVSALLAGLGQDGRSDRASGRGPTEASPRTWRLRA